MLDIKWIRDNCDQFDNLLFKRGISPLYEKISKLDEEKRQYITLLQQLQHARKTKSKTLGQIKDHSSSSFLEIKRDVSHINDKISELQEKLQIDNDLQAILDRLPNLPDSDVPYGTNSDMNVQIRAWEATNKKISSKPHFEIGEDLNIMDFTQTAKISGSRFVTLKADLATLERALVNFMLDMHTREFGFTEMSVPYLVRPEAMYNTGQLPKLSDDSFVTTDGYRLIPTGEVSLTNIVADRILAREELPIRYTAYTPCFRSEAGAASRDARGMIRLHQFGKVELVSITTPSDSSHEHEYITNVAEEVLRRLDLSYRVMLLCTGDMGFSAKKTYDIEVWMPGQGQYREISSCSNCGDFQARRMKARYKEFGVNETTLVHTLNGSAMPTGRTLVAILENYSNSDGSITIPNVLRKYMNNQEKIQPEIE
jgi:seryl-tRNA synthetase